MIVGFQGEPGAFSEEVALKLFDDAETRGYETFEGLLTAVDSSDVAFGVLPCENTIYGPVTQAYDLLRKYADVRVVDEAVHRIEQALIGLPGASLPALRRIESHPVALEQCRGFLATLSEVEIVAAADTAGAVREIIARADTTCAAIGPAPSARRYGGVILANAIQDEWENYTRFFVIARNGGARRGLGRAVLAFTLPHRPGSLYVALANFVKRQLNLRALVVRPLPNRPFEYAFYAELDCPNEAEASRLVQEIAGDARLVGWF